MPDPVVTPPVITGGDKPWYDGAITDAVEVGHVQNRGWDKLPVRDAAVAAIRAHKEAERLIGVPATQLVRLPTDVADEAGWKTVYQRLGAPVDAKKYDEAIATVKFADGSAIDQPLVDTLRAIATKNNLSITQATEIAKSLVKFASDGDGADAADAQAKLAIEKAGLKTDWGAHFDANFVVAKAAANKLGIPAEAIAAFEGQVGYKTVMQMFHKIGTSLGEDKFIRDNNSGNAVLTREQAAAKMSELKQDNDWSKRYLAGGAAERREMDALIRIAHASA